MPREWLTRSTAPGLAGAPAAQISDGGRVLHGHFAVFNRWTRIAGDRGFDPYMEQIAQGAFAKTFRENGARIRVLLNHGQDGELGSRPIAALTSLREDSIGAAYTADLLDGLPEMVVDGIRHGLYGSSFAFRPIKERYEPRPKRSDHNPRGLPERIVTEAAVREFGPTTFPAYAAATAGLRGDVNHDARVVDAPPRVVLPPASRVEVTASAYEELVASPLSDGLEVGGSLLGRREDDVLIVEHFFEDAFAERFSHEVVFSKRHLEAAERTGQLLGDLHSHPSGSSAVPVASDDDLKAWLSRARYFGGPGGLPEWLSLIAGPTQGIKLIFVENSHLWVKPVLSAYVTSPHGTPERVPVTVQSPAAVVAA